MYIYIYIYKYNWSELYKIICKEDNGNTAAEMCSIKV